MSREVHTVLFGRPLHYLSEVKKALSRMKLIRPKNKFAAKVLDMMDRHTIGIHTGLQLRDAPHPTWGYCFSRLRQRCGNRRGPSSCNFF